MPERLQKFLSRAGVASRRRSEEFILAGRVKVNGVVVTELGTRIEPFKDVVHFDNVQISADQRFVYLLLYKPTQVISAVSDPQGRPVVTDLIPTDYGRVYPVGRLDWDSEGAILMTNDGELTDLLTHPRHEVSKVYMVKLRGHLRNDDERIIRVRNGVRLDDGYQTQPCDVILDGGTERHSWFVVSIKEGRNRQIRRMFEAVGMTVLKLKRIAYGPVQLGEMMPGTYRRLDEGEIEELYEAAGKKRPTLSAARGRLHHTRRKAHSDRTRDLRKEAKAGGAAGASSKPQPGKPSAGKPSASKPSAGKPSAGKPSAGKPATASSGSRSGGSGRAGGSQERRPTQGAAGARGGARADDGRPPRKRR